MLDVLESLDQQLFLFLNSHPSNLLDSLCYWVSQPFFWVPFYLLLIYWLAKALKRKTWVVLLMVAILITLSDQFASSLVKPWVQRLRPCQDPQIRHLVHVAGTYSGLYGFISSHAANTFSLAMLLWLLLRKHYRYIYLLFFWAGAVSYARVYGGVHYPGDILVGALVGLCLGWLIYQIYLHLPAFMKG